MEYDTLNKVYLSEQMILIHSPETKPLWDDSQNPSHDSSEVAFMPKYLIISEYILE